MYMPVRGAVATLPWHKQIKGSKRQMAEGPKYFVEIDGTEYPWEQDTITVAQIRELGKIPAGTPVIEVDPDNNEITLSNDATITLKPGHRYGKKVKFKRG